MEALTHINFSRVIKSHTILKHLSTSLWNK